MRDFTLKKIHGTMQGMIAKGVLRILGKGRVTKYVLND